MIQQQWMAYLTLVVYGIYLLGWHLFQRFKQIRRLVNGSAEVSLKEARLHRIIFRRKRDPEEIARREDFLTVDDGIISMERLKEPQWTVYSIDKKRVFLVELPHPLSYYSIDKYPFIFVPLFDHAIRLAELDLDAYVALGDQLEVDYKAPRTLFFTNTARCASTLFGSMLQHEGRSLVIAEHHGLTILSLGLKEGYWNDNDINRILPATVKYLRKRIPADQLMVFKTTSSEVNLVPYLTQLFPEMKHIFMFRRRGLASVERVIHRDPQYLALLQLYNFSPYLATLFGFLVANEGPLQRQLKPAHIKEWSMLVYGGSYLTYKQNKDAFDYPVVWHDELIDHPEKILKPIFDDLDLPESCIPAAVERTQRDSQANTFLSRDSLQHITITEMTPELKKSLHRYAEKLQMEPDVAGIED